jgi:hypothetical protein
MISYVLKNDKYEMKVPALTFGAAGFERNDCDDVYFEFLDKYVELKEFKAQAMDVFNECKKKNYAKDIAEKVIVLLENLDSKLDEFDNAEYTEEE